MGQIRTQERGQLARHLEGRRPLPEYIDNSKAEAIRYLSFFLATIVLFGPGLVFYEKGLPALFRGQPDMNALVAVGTLARRSQARRPAFVRVRVLNPFEAPRDPLRALGQRGRDALVALGIRLCLGNRSGHSRRHPLHALASGAGPASRGGNAPRPGTYAADPCGSGSRHRTCS